MREYYNQNGIVVRDAKKTDVDYLKDHLKQSDIDEVRASHNYMPEEALRISLEKSLFCYTVENSHPIAMFGVCAENILDEKAVIWLLGSNDMEKIQIRFLLNCRKFIKYFLTAYPYLENYVDERNKKTIRWLKFCGFTVESAVPYGVNNLPFCNFYIKRGK